MARGIGPCVGGNRPFKGKGKLELVKFGETPIGRATFEPGWRWSENVKPIAQTDRCQANHLSYVLQGTMHIKHNDGTEIESWSGRRVRRHARA